MPDRKRTVIDMEATARQLKALCEEREISPQMIAEALGFSSVTSIYKWFQGKNLPKLDNAVELKELLGVMLDDMFVTKKV